MPSKLLENSTLRFCTVAGLLVSTAAFCWRAAVTLTRLEVAVADIKASGYTMSQAAEAALREAIENPGFRKVDPRDPSKIIFVKPSTSGSTGGPIEWSH